MDINGLIKKLKQSFSSGANGALEEGITFGVFSAQKWPAIWVSRGAGVRVLLTLSAEASKLGIRALENMVCIEIDGDLMISYFFSLENYEGLLVVRVALETDAQFETMRMVWPISGLFEQEISALFGVKFKGFEENADDVQIKLLPSGWFGHPLKKDYLYPSEFYGIHHMRPTQATAPDEFGVVS